MDTLFLGQSVVSFQELFHKREKHVLQQRIGVQVAFILLLPLQQLFQELLLRDLVVQSNVELLDKHVHLVRIVPDVLEVELELLVRTFYLEQRALGVIDLPHVVEEFLIQELHLQTAMQQLQFLLVEHDVLLGPCIVGDHVVFVPDAFTLVFIQVETQFV